MSFGAEAKFACDGSLLFAHMYGSTRGLVVRSGNRRGADLNSEPKWRFRVSEAVGCDLPSGND